MTTAREAVEGARMTTADQIGALDLEFERFVAAAELVATDDEHDPEGHTIAVERQQVAGLLRAARRHLVELDLAVERLDAGTYGTCEGCGQAIATERLDALPAARTCVACAR